MHRLYWLIILTTLLVGGCGSEQAGVCDPGATQLCFCDANTQVVQTCRDDGSGWAQCPCSAPVPTFPDTTTVDDTAQPQDLVTVSDAGGQECTPGNAKPCTCLDTGQSGMMGCLPNGNGWGACECAPVPTDAGSNPSDPGSQQMCVPGSSQSCSCGPGQSGMQTCNDAGTLWQACACEATDAGSSDQDTAPVDPNGLCNDRTKVIWLLSNNNNGLVRFDPQTLNLQMIGNLACTAGFGESPFSMAVDRYANAWVEYQTFTGTGNIFKVSTEDASCQATGYPSGQGGFDLFGMAFVSDGPQSTTDTLFISGGSFFDVANGNAYLKLGSIDTNVPNLPLTTHGTFSLPSLPELTGTGGGELYGFYPNNNPPTIQQIDKTTGGSIVNYSVNGLNVSLGSDYAYAFAFWGGDFYLFLKTSSDLTSNIWRFTPGNPNAELLIQNSGYVIVGAGVSTCAPTTSDAN